MIPLQNPVITITQEELEKIEDMARRFCDFKRGKTNLKQDEGKSDYEVNRLGFAGELAVHKFFEIPYAYQFKRYRTLVDIILHFEGREIVGDIKTSHDGWLRVPKWHFEDLHVKEGEKVPNTYIPVQADEDLRSFEILGIISKAKMQRVAHLKKFYTECYCMDKYFQQYELQPIQLLTR